MGSGVGLGLGLDTDGSIGNSMEMGYRNSSLPTGPRFFLLSTLLSANAKLNSTEVKDGLSVVPKAQG